MPNRAAALSPSCPAGRYRSRLERRDRAFGRRGDPQQIRTNGASSNRTAAGALLGAVRPAFRCSSRHIWIFALALLAGISQTATSSACDLTNLTIAIDIGHSIANPGAISATGKTEYAFNHRFAEEFVKTGEIRTSIRFEIIDQRGKDLSLGARAAAAGRLSAGLFLSFHHDSVNPKYLEKPGDNDAKPGFSRHARGYSIFVSSRNPRYGESLELARAIGKAFRRGGLPPSLHHAEMIAGENRDLLDPDLGIYDAPFAVIAKNTVPAILIELGVIVHPEEERTLERPAYRERLISDILDGVGNYCR